MSTLTTGCCPMEQAPTTTFQITRSRWATTPPEHRGIPRDGVRLLIAQGGSEPTIRHTRFDDITSALGPGDLLVVNNSRTRPAAIDGHRPSGEAPGPSGTTRLVVHLSTLLRPGTTWVVELRRSEENPVGSNEGDWDDGGPMLDGTVGDRVCLAGDATIELLRPVAAGPRGRGTRLWEASVTLQDGVEDPSRIADHMATYGRPIRYAAPATNLLKRFGQIPLRDYQTVFAASSVGDDAWGSAEMASAGRPFSDRLVARLISDGVRLAPITLHAGVSSQTVGEAPQPEWFTVPESTAALVNHTRSRGGRVIAVGTTVTRALESASDSGAVRPASGWTDLVITPERGVDIVDGLITGWHEADASHLLLLEAVAGSALVGAAYARAVAGPYLWHEFGDSCLLLPQSGQ